MKIEKVLHLKAHIWKIIHFNEMKIEKVLQLKPHIWIIPKRNWFLLCCLLMLPYCNAITLSESTYEYVMWPEWWNHTFSILLDFNILPTIVKHGINVYYEKVGYTIVLCIIIISHSPAILCTDLISDIQSCLYIIC